MRILAGSTRSVYETMNGRATKRVNRMGSTGLLGKVVEDDFALAGHYILFFRSKLVYIYYHSIIGGTYTSISLIL